MFIVFEMVNKAIKHVKKKNNKKQVKQSLRNKLRQRKTINNNVVNQQAVNQQAVNPNSVRNQLMMRAMSGLPMGVGVGNDAVFDMQRKLNNAVMDTANDKRINDDMKKQIEKNEKEKKALKDENKALKNRLLKSGDDVEALREELSHKEHIQSQFELNEQRKQHLQEDIAAIDNENNNNEGQITTQQLKAELHAKRMKKEQLNNELNKNEMYISNKNLQQTIDYEVAEMMGVQEALNSPEFKESFAKRIELTKKHEINKVISELNRKLYDKQQETYELQMMLAAQPTDKDLAPYVKQFSDKIKKLNDENEKKRQALRDKEDAIKIFNYRREAINKLAQEQVDLEIENERLASEQASLDNKLNAMKQKEKTQANATQKTERAVKKKKKSVNAKQQAVDNNNNDDDDKSLLNVDDDKFESEEQRYTRRNAQLRGNNEEYKKRIQLAKEQIEEQSKFDEKKAELEFVESPEYKNIVQGNEGIKEQTMRIEKETEQLNVLNKEKQHMQQTLYDRSVQEKSLTGGLSAVQQTTELVKMANASLDEMGQKQDIVSKLNQEAAANKQLWAAFVQMYPQANELLLNEKYNAALTTYQQLYQQFLSFKNQQLRQINVPQPQFVNSNF